MNVKVLLYKDAKKNKQKMPLEWPYRMEPIKENEKVKDPWIEMTMEEFEAYREKNKHLYLEWEEKIKKPFDEKLSKCEKLIKALKKVLKEYEELQSQDVIVPDYVKEWKLKLEEQEKLYKEMRRNPYE